MRHKVFLFFVVFIFALQNKDRDLSKAVLLSPGGCFEEQFLTWLNVYSDDDGLQTQSILEMQS